MYSVKMQRLNHNSRPLQIADKSAEFVQIDEDRNWNYIIVSVPKVDT